MLAGRVERCRLAPVAGAVDRPARNGGDPAGLLSQTGRVAVKGPGTGPVVQFSMSFAAMPAGTSRYSASSMPKAPRPWVEPARAEE